ncbi:MAG: DUF2953 domain-containing protein [Oscillospiraceae bacterium]
MTALFIIGGIIALIVVLLHFSVRADCAVSSGKPFELRVKWLWFTLYPAKPRKHRLRRFLAKFRRKKKPAQPVAEATDSIPEPVFEPEAEPPDVEPAASAVTAAQTAKAGKAAEKERKTLLRREKKLEKQLAKERKKQGKASRTGGKLEQLKALWEKLLPYLQTAGRYTRRTLKTIRFTGLEVHLTAGKEDAYESAMLYGKLNAALFNLLGIVASIFTVRVKSADVACVFNENKFAYAVRGTVKIRPSALIAISFSLGIRLLAVYLKQRRAAKRARKHEEQNTKKQKFKETELLTNE